HALPAGYPDRHARREHRPAPRALARLFACGRGVGPSLPGIRQGSRRYRGDGRHVSRVLRQAVTLRRSLAVPRVFVLCAVMTALAAVRATAQPSPPDQTPAAPSPAFEKTFNFDATWGSFGFLNSLYANPKPDEPSGNLGDNWFEGSMKAALTVGFTTVSNWKLWGKASAVGERTYGPTPSLVGSDASSFQVEDLAVGIKSGTALSSLGDDALELTIGRAPYKLGHQLLVGDGS